MIDLPQAAECWHSMKWLKDPCVPETDRFSLSSRQKKEKGCWKNVMSNHTVTKNGTGNSDFWTLNDASLTS